jgi:hypothetical protein
MLFLCAGPGFGLAEGLRGLGDFAGGLFAVQFHDSDTILFHGVEIVFG